MQNTVLDEIDSHDYVGINEFRQIEIESNRIIENLRKAVFAPDKVKRLDLKFTITEAAEMSGRSSVTIRQYEKDGQLPPPRLDKKGRRDGYTLSEINNMREVFGTLLWKSDGDEPIKIIIQNFKGGVGKSTMAVNLSHYLSLKGYRVCLVDCDPQGTATSLFGFNPDDDIPDAHTLFPFFEFGGESTLDYALKKTHWPNLYLIPSNLSLHDAEYELQERVKTDENMYDRLRYGISTIEDKFDVIILDPPPSLGAISLNVLRAGNALIVPIIPSQIDFCSTRHFFSMLRQAAEKLQDRDVALNYKFLKVLASKVDESIGAHKLILGQMRKVYGSYMLDPIVKKSAEIDSAAFQLSSIYELASALNKKQTFERAKAFMNAVCGQIELQIRRTWNSHHDDLRKNGLI